MHGRLSHLLRVPLAVTAAGLTFGVVPAFSATKKPKKPAVPPPAAVAPAKTAPALKAKPLRKVGPNVLFIVADDLNDWVGWMGGHPQARTPNMDRLARMGMSFTNAHCAYALCNPSRTAMLTGMWPWKSGVSGNEQDWRLSKQVQGKPTLPEYFRLEGFMTAAGGKIFHANHGGPEGRLAGWHGGRRGFEQDAAWDQRFPEAGVQIPDLPVHTGRNFNGLDIWHWDWGAIDTPEDGTDDGKVATWAGQFLQKQPKTIPFFLAVGLYRPHSPWYVPRKYFDERPLAEVRLPEVKVDDLNDVPAASKTYLNGENLHQKILDSKLWPSAVQAYLANVSFCDAMVGRVLDSLERSAHKDRTIIVFTSDHGWYLGEKQRWHKGGLWEEATRVPLVIVAPGVTQPGVQTKQPVSLVDLYPTLCDLVALPKPAHLDGETLLPLLKDPAATRTRAALTASGAGDKASLAVRTDRWRYIVNYDGTEELYDHEADPNEWTNLARYPEHQDLIKRLFTQVPQQWNAASRKMAEVKLDSAADGSATWWLQGGDSFSADESPDIAERAIDLEVVFQYNPAVDRDSTLISQGGPQLGFAVHLVDGKPGFTVNYEGLRTTLKSAEPLPAGRIVLRALLGLDGTLALTATGLKSEVRGYTPMEDGFPRKPAQGLQVAQSFGVLPVKDFPNSTPFDGALERVRFTLLPGVRAETRAAKAVPVE